MVTVAPHATYMELTPNSAGHIHLGSMHRHSCVRIRRTWVTILSKCLAGMFRLGMHRFVASNIQRGLNQAPIAWLLC